LSCEDGIMLHTQQNCVDQSVVLKNNEENEGNEESVKESSKIQGRMHIQGRTKRSLLAEEATNYLNNEDRHGVSTLN